MRVQKKYDSVFRRDAVALTMKGERSVADVARDLGVAYPTLWQWYNAAMGKRRKTSPKTTAREEIAGDETLEEKVRRLEAKVAFLEKKNGELEMDRAILKKAAAFFAKESG